MLPSSYPHTEISELGTELHGLPGGVRSAFLASVRPWTLAGCRSGEQIGNLGGDTVLLSGPLCLCSVSRGQMPASQEKHLPPYQPPLVLKGEAVDVSVSKPQFFLKMYVLLSGAYCH